MVVAKRGKIKGTKFQIVLETFKGEISEKAYIERIIIWIGTRGSVSGVPVEKNGPYFRNLTRKGCAPLPSDLLGRYRIEEHTERGWKKVAEIPHTKIGCQKPVKPKKKPKKGKEKKVKK